MAKGKYKLSLDMGGGGISEEISSSEKNDSFKANISEKTFVTLFTADAGAATKTGYFIPNLHNGLFRISAYLTEHKIENTMICVNSDDMDDAWEKISTYKIPVAGFSPYYNTLPNDIENIMKLRKLSPETLIVIGGFEASLNNQWEKMYKAIDLIVYGEGEIPMIKISAETHKFLEKNPEKGRKELKEYLAKVFKKSNFPGVKILDDNGKTLYHRQAERISNETYEEISMNAFVKHLAESPIDKYWELSHRIFKGKRDMFFRFVSTDHCPWKCVFCQSSIYFSKVCGLKSTPVRALEPEQVLEIMKSVSRNYPFIKHIYIDDENFLLNRKRALKTASLVAEAKEQGGIREEMTFLCRGRTNNIDKELCEGIKKAGWELISTGSESYSQKELDYMLKGSTPEINRKAIDTILGCGMKVAENFILFTPVTTEDSFYSTAVNILKNNVLGVDVAATPFLSPLPGTALWGNGEFESTGKDDITAVFGENKEKFYSPSAGLEYLGETVEIKGCGITLPHPEIVLVKDPLMREVSVKSIVRLPESFEELAEHRGDDCIQSRRIITMANLHSITKILYEKTGLSKWNDFLDEILDETLKLDISKDF